MIFGNKSEFGIEVEIQNESLGEEYCGNQIVGRMRLWLGGATFGDFEEDRSWIGPPASELTWLAESADRFWRPELDRLTPAERFDYLNLVHYDAVRKAVTSRDRRESQPPPSFLASMLVQAGGKPAPSAAPDDDGLDPTFMLNSSEIFDGWKAFITSLPAGLAPQPPQVQFLWVSPDDEHEEVKIHSLQRDTFRAIVQDFTRWFEAHNTSWLEHRRLAPGP